MLSRLGYVVRTFQEDNNTSASWGYTVGVKVNERPVCLFMRVPIEPQLMDSILSDVAAMVRMTGIPSIPFYVNDFETKSGERLRFKLERMGPGVADILGTNHGCYIEGQAEGTVHYWLFAADERNKLPGEDGYQDWRQLVFPVRPADPVSDDTLMNEI